MRNRTTLRTRTARTARTARTTRPESAEPWWKRHGRGLWIGVGLPVVGAVLTAVALQLVGLGGESEPSAASGDSDGDAAPFTVTARQENEEGCTALPDKVSAPQDRAELVSGGDVNAVIRRNDGARAGELTVGITFEGGARSLTITSIDIRPKSPKPQMPLSGTLLCEPGAGGEPKIQLYADMDDPEPVFRTGENATQRYFKDKVITLRPGEQVNLSAIFRAEESSRAFGLMIRYVQDGKQHTLPARAPSGGRYAVTGYAKRYGVVYRGSADGGYRRVEKPQPCSWLPAAQREGC
ncbi:hypothetical protein ABZV77_13530 [Streptomyces sp. NPDC004732]|uniref:hypothetical protein n=1 Tax=Streptomyces sp. NPDC004732 TaxID=3154290 RepID=UPI0033AA804E